MAEIGKPIVLNICMLGALIGLTKLVRPRSVVKMVKSKISSDFLEINEKAFEIGMRLAESPETLWTASGS
jgi:2-oxoglutarate ferredoxin oxidoreductase subunit gamma